MKAHITKAGQLTVSLDLDGLAQQDATGAKLVLTQTDGTVVLETQAAGAVGATTFELGFDLDEEPAAISTPWR